MPTQISSKIAIIGGGIAGSSIALYLANLGLDVTLFEKKATLVDGPPICHLHAGGNLYREISDAQCLKLLHESIELIELYPCAVDFRPTVIAVPLEDSGEPKDLFSRLELLKSEYAKLVKRDIKKRVLGSVDEYYKIYTREDIERLRLETEVENPVSFDEWMIPVAKSTDLNRLKFPLIMVQEYGLNIFRLAASVSLGLKEINSASILTNTEVKGVLRDKDTYVLKYQNDTEEDELRFDYLINAAGFKSGEIDDMLGFHRKRYVEFKAAYVTKWQSEILWPEVIFYGERGTPQGMAQFTPYPNGYIQLHGMTEEITLFEDGLVKSTSLSAQPQLSEKYIHKIYKGWKRADVEKRSTLAIEHIAHFIPSFKSATLTAKPLFGAQQIPGEDATLRAAEVSFEGDRYARCEIVKASSVLSMADAITKELIDLNYLPSEAYMSRSFQYFQRFREEDVSSFAQELCLLRSYPISLASRNRSSLVL